MNRDLPNLPELDRAAALLGGLGEYGLVAAAGLLLDPPDRPGFDRPFSGEGDTDFPRGARPLKVPAPMVGPTILAIDVYLQEFCAELAAALVGPGGPTITCKADAVSLPRGTARAVGFITGELVCNALQHGFTNGRGGRIAVSFAACEEELCLQVDDSGFSDPDRPSARFDDLALTPVLIRQLAGAFESVCGLIGGNRAIVTLPRERARSVEDAGRGNGS